MGYMKLEDRRLEKTICLLRAGFQVLTALFVLTQIVWDVMSYLISSYTRNTTEELSFRDVLNLGHALPLFLRVKVMADTKNVYDSISD
jgi:hypothetical protein